MDFCRQPLFAEGERPAGPDPAEKDRHHVLPSGDPEAGRKTVREPASALYDPAGGIIVQFEFGPGAKIETALVAMDEWRQITA